MTQSNNRLDLTSANTHPRPTEAGFTFVELMICLTLLAVAIFGLAAVTTAAVRMTGLSGHRTRAEAIASREIEALKAVPYARLGFAASQTPPSFEGSPAVVVSEPPSPLIPLTSTETPVGQEFTVTRHIVWADSTIGATTYSKAFKRTIVLVDWTDQAGGHRVRQDSNVYPPGSGLHSTTTTAVPAVGNPDPPVAPLSAVTPAAPDGTTRIDLSWTAPSPSTAPPVASWVIDWSVDPANVNGWNRVTDSHPESSTQFSMNGLSPDTPYWFRVFSRSAAGTLSTTAVTTATSVSTLPLTPATCVVSGSIITPKAVKRSSVAGSTTLLESNAYVAVNTLGGCTSGLQLLYTTNTLASPVTIPMSAAAATAPKVFAATVNGTSTIWDIGTHQLSVVNPATGLTLSQISFTVCTRNATTCP